MDDGMKCQFCGKPLKVIDGGYKCDCQPAMPDDITAGETPEQQRDEEPLPCPDCGCPLVHDTHCQPAAWYCPNKTYHLGMGYPMFRSDIPIYNRMVRALLASRAAQEEVVRLREGIEGLRIYSLKQIESGSDFADIPLHREIKKLLGRGDLK